MLSFTVFPPSSLLGLYALLFTLHLVQRRRVKANASLLDGDGVALCNDNGKYAVGTNGKRLFLLSPPSYNTTSHARFPKVCGAAIAQAPWSVAGAALLGCGLEPRSLD